MANASGGNNSSSSRKDSLRPTVPRSASTASAQLRRAVQTALVSGKRHMIVDVLLADIDPRQRTYDERSAREVYVSLASCGTLLSSIGSSSGGGGGGSISNGDEEEEKEEKERRRRRGTHMVVSGATTAMRVRSWLLQSSSSNTTISAAAAVADDNTRNTTTTIGILGTKESMGLAQEKDLVVFMIDPDSGVKGLVDLRKALQSVIGDTPTRRQQVFLPRDNQKATTAVVICNHPREGRLHEALRYDGARPVEMLEFEDIFVLIPFSVMHRSPDAPRDDVQQVRFVLMKQFPWKWGFWVFVANKQKQEQASSEGNGSVRQDDEYKREKGNNGNGAAAISEQREHGRGEYVLFREFDWRPDDGDIDVAIRESLAELID